MKDLISCLGIVEIMMVKAVTVIDLGCTGAVLGIQELWLYSILAAESLSAWLWS